MLCRPVGAFLELTVSVVHKSKLKAKNQVILVQLVVFQELFRLISANWLSKMVISESH